MKVLQSSWLDRRGMKLQLQAWEPDRSPKAVVALVHGMGEHIARYAPVGEALVRAGYAVMGFDLRGHGRSDGPRGHTPSYEDLMDDLEALMVQVRARHPRRPVFLHGHSLGGGLAINYVLRRSLNLRGVIATSPWLRTRIEVHPLRLTLARLIEPIIPAYSQTWGPEPAALSQDAAVVDAYEHDPLTHDRISVRMYLECARAGLWALEHAAEFPLPLLLMHGTADRITAWEASMEFAQRLGRRVTWRSWDGWYHELHNEPESDRVLKTMVAWMNRRLGTKRIRRASAGQMRPGMRKSRPIRRPVA